MESVREEEIVRKHGASLVIRRTLPETVDFDTERYVPIGTVEALVTVVQNTDLTSNFRQYQDKAVVVRTLIAGYHHPS